MKKALLVDPTFNPGNIPPNLGMGRIEAALSASGVGSEVVDFVEFGTENISLSKFEKLENEFILQAAERSTQHEVVYISGSHGMELKPYAMFPRIRSVATAIKKVNPNATVIMGGALASYYSKVLNLDPRLMTESCIDEVVLGQEVSAAKVILNRMGVEYRTPLNAFNQNALQPSWKAWDLTKYPDYISLMIRTGCPYTCSFCFEGAVYDPKIPQALPADIPKIVENLKSRHQINSVIVEDSIAISLPWFPDLVERMGVTDLTWAIYARSNEIVQHSKRLAGLSEAGCKSLIVGIESFEDELHLATKKKITTNQTLNALRLCEENGLAVQGCLILAFPDDTLQKIESRIQVAQGFNLSTYRWHVLQPNWGRLPENIRGLDGLTAEGILDVQVSMPDSCIPEYLEKCPPMAIYDEHLLIRALHSGADVKRLEGFGYGDGYNFRDFMKVAAPLIAQSSLPVNEDSMYPALFSTTQPEIQQPPPQFTTSIPAHLQNDGPV